MRGRRATNGKVNDKQETGDEQSGDGTSPDIYGFMHFFKGVMWQKGRGMLE